MIRGPKKRRKQAPEGLLGASVVALFFSNLALSTLPPFFPHYAMYELDLDEVSIALVFTALPIMTTLGSWVGSAVRHSIDDGTQLFIGNIMLVIVMMRIDRDRIGGLLTEQGQIFRMLTHRFG